ncbi:MAG TPA: GyrI-like domain-containing protein, partial [Anaerolineaceae bacterium]
LRGYTGLYAWVEANGYIVSGPVREFYLQEPEEETASMVEVQFPVERNRHWKAYQKVGQDQETKMDAKKDVKIITTPAMKLVGLRYQGKNQNGEIAGVWDAFNRRCLEIPNLVRGDAYGVCRVPAGLPEGEFEYICAMPVSGVGDVPAGMVTVDLPELKCAAYPHIGKLDNLGESYEAFYKGWLPQSGMEALEPGFDMEWYGKEFDFSDTSVFYILLPLK